MFDILFIAFTNLLMSVLPTNALTMLPQIVDARSGVLGMPNAYRQRYAAFGAIPLPLEH